MKCMKHLYFLTDSFSGEGLKGLRPEKLNYYKKSVFGELKGNFEFP